jgi:hypothetical protein
LHNSDSGREKGANVSVRIAHFTGPFSRNLRAKVPLLSTEFFIVAIWNSVCIAIFGFPNILESHPSLEQEVKPCIKDPPENLLSHFFLLFSE